MFGYATDETPRADAAADRAGASPVLPLTEVRKNGTLPYLRPDGKTQVTIEYDGDKPVRLDTVVLSTQHAADIYLENMLAPTSSARSSTWCWPLMICPGARHLRCAAAGQPDRQVRARRTDGRCGLDRPQDHRRHLRRNGRHGGAFSGKDPSKVDRSAAYAMRWVAKNAVAAGLAKRIEVQVAYAIGKAAPVGLLFVETFGTHTVDELIQKAISEVFDLRPLAIIRDLDLLRPIYGPTAAYGHFGRTDVELPWESTDRAEKLRAAAGL